MTRLPLFARTCLSTRLGTAFYELKDLPDSLVAEPGWFRTIPSRIENRLLLRRPGNPGCHAVGFACGRQNHSGSYDA